MDEYMKNPKLQKGVFEVIILHQKHLHLPRRRQNLTRQSHRHLGRKNEIRKVLRRARLPSNLKNGHHERHGQLIRPVLTLIERLVAHIIAESCRQTDQPDHGSAFV